MNKSPITSSVTVLGVIGLGPDHAGGLPDDRYENLATCTRDTELWPSRAAALLAKSHGSTELAAWRDQVHEYTFATFSDGMRLLI